MLWLIPARTAPINLQNPTPNNVQNDTQACYYGHAQPSAGTITGRRSPRMSTAQDMKARLREQLGFLRRSAAAVDAGSKEEAIRIAAALRVIFHDTPNSTSLLSHLHATNTIIRSMAPDRSNEAAQLRGLKVHGEFSWSLATMDPHELFHPITTPCDTDRLIEAPLWWDEKIAHLDGVDYTRRKVVLWAANKDGGAHVDSHLPADYDQLKAEGAFGTTEDSLQESPSCSNRPS